MFRGRTRLILAALPWLLPITVASQEATAPPTEAIQAGSVRFEFASPQRGRDVLGRADEFVALMSPFDRQVRMKTERDEGQQAFLKFASNEVRAWPDDHRAKVTKVIRDLHMALSRYSLPKLQPVLLIHTTGAEEGGAAYTRQNAIVLPRPFSSRPSKKLIAHELFHVLSRQHPKLRDRLYAAVGFQPCQPVRLPGEMQDRRLTNPDAPQFAHRIEVKLDESQSASLVPVLYAKEKYDHREKGSLFRYMEFRLLQLTPDLSQRFVPKLVEGKPVLHTPQLPDFHRQIGRNTGYIIHPEEILADNFALLVTDSEAVKDPWLIEAIRDQFRVAEGEKK